MAQVFAESPSAAFAASSNLDQQRVQNFLASLAQNQQTQLRGYDAASQQAAARQAAQERQQQQMLQVAQLISNTRQNREAETYNRSQDALRMMLKNREFDSDTKFRDWQMGQGNPRTLALEDRRAQEAKAETELAGQSERLAQYLNEHTALKAMLAKIPETSADQNKIADQEAPLPSNLSRMTLIPWLSGKLGEQQDKRDIAVRSRIAGSVPSYLNPTEFETADKTEQFVKIAKDKLNARIQQLEKFIPTKGVDEMVAIGPSGRYESLFRRNPLLTSGTGTTAPAAETQRSQPSIGTPRNAAMYVAAAEAAVQQGADPAKVAARLEQLLKAGQ